MNRNRTRRRRTGRSLSWSTAIPVVAAVGLGALALGSAWRSQNRIAPVTPAMARVMTIDLPQEERGSINNWQSFLSCYPLGEDRDLVWETVGVHEFRDQRFLWPGQKIEIRFPDSFHAERSARWNAAERNAADALYRDGSVNGACPLPSLPMPMPPDPVQPAPDTAMNAAT